MTSCTLRMPADWSTRLASRRTDEPSSLNVSRSALSTAAIARCGSQTRSSGPAAWSCSTISSAPPRTAARAASASWARWTATLRSRWNDSGRRTARQSHAASTSSMQATPWPTATRRRSGSETVDAPGRIPPRMSGMRSSQRSGGSGSTPSIGGRRPSTTRVEKCSTSRSRSMAGLVTTATVSWR